MTFCDVIRRNIVLRIRYVIKQVNAFVTAKRFDGIYSYND